uniref:Uncharacterized protein n=1 Tax=Arundo donax TaxID=35708 RepID=A0A0A9B124_ARUDO
MFETNTELLKTSQLSNTGRRSSLNAIVVQISQVNEVAQLRGFPQVFILLDNLKVI